MKENVEKHETGFRKKMMDKISDKHHGTTNFREVADKKKRNEVCCSILPPSNPNSPFSWYIPSDPPSRSNSNNSDKMTPSRQNSVESPPMVASKATNFNQRSRASSMSNTNHYNSFGWNSNRANRNKHFGQMYPSRQASQESDIVPSNQCRGIQTGNSLLRMYLKKVSILTFSFLIPLPHPNINHITYNVFYRI